MTATTAPPDAPLAPPGAPAAPPRRPARDRARFRASAPALVAAAVTVAVGTVALAGDGPAPPRPAPAFSLAAVRTGHPAVTLPPAGRPVVLNFFASWCIPCVAELPVLERAHRRVGGRVAFVGIDVADSRTRAVELLDQAGVSFAAGYDPERRVAARYRLRGMPTTVFIDAGGRVVATETGRLTVRELDRRLAALENGRVGNVRADAKG